MKPLQFTDANFKNEVINSDLPVVVDFWATWCGPCRAIAPIIEDLANEYPGKIKVGKLDIDENQETAIQFGVRSIPTVLFFKGGKIVDSIIGAVPKTHFVQKLNTVM